LYEHTGSPTLPFKVSFQKFCPNASEVIRRGSRVSPKASSFDSGTSSGEPFDEPIPGVLENGFVDYYEILQIDDDANLAEIKAAYRSLAKVCHPDFLGDKGHNLCILLNEAYDVLSDPQRREAYNLELEQAIADSTDGYTGKPLSKWAPGTGFGKNEDPNETRGVFVDENTCIGCKMCVWCAPATFRIEPDFGRSRVFGQWLDTEDDLQAAIDSCPVSCIHWVEKEELPALEYVMQKMDRVNVSAMMGQGTAVGDVFDAAQRFVKDRREREERMAKARAYSPAQEAARQAAAEEIMRQNLGWFAGAMRGFMGMANDVVAGSPGSRTGGGERVGERKRSRRQTDGPGSAVGENGATIPPERALVPVGAKADRTGGR